jgi:hypothetical protein
MAFADLSEDSPIVRRDIQITPFMERIVLETGPFAVNLPARDRSTHEPHHVAVAVIGAGIAVLRDGSAELGYHDDGRIAVDRSEALRERRQPLRKRTEQISELTFHATLICVSIPSADSQEAQLHTRIATHERSEPRGIAHERIRR